jgi:FAD/FMN-containing dehydrogenase
MTRTASGGIDALRATHSGPVLLPGDDGYDEARTVWNGDIDRRPAVIARCRTADDVAAALRTAQENGLEIAVRGGGHAFSGRAVCDDGLMVDLSLMREVRVDPVGRRAVAGGGATQADVDAATQAHGLATTGGTISHTGVGGLALGGGMGWLTHKMGLMIDNLVAAEVVVPDGRCLRASADEHPDLFWAVRGGGGNFGVVTAFEFALHPVGPEVHLGLLFYAQSDSVAALTMCRELFPTLSDDAGLLIGAALNAPPLPAVPEEHHFAPGHAVMVVGAGTAEEHAAAVAPFRERLRPLFEIVTPIPYVALQQMLDAAAPFGTSAYEKSLDIEELTDDVIAVLTESAARKASPMSFLPIFYLSGAFCRVGEDETAFSGSRTPHYAIHMAGISPDPSGLDVERAWVRSLWDSLRPLVRSDGAYVNFIGDVGEDQIRDAYGAAKYDRLARIKAEYDPGNVLHRNANIKPAG